MSTVAWVLNLEADLELADPAGHAPSSRQLERTAARAQQFLDVANAAGAPPVRHVALTRREGGTVDCCRAWCATPRAQAMASAAGRELVPAPPLEVIRRVNHRAFAAAIAAGLPGGAFATSMAELDAVFAQAAPADGWLLKRPFGFSGRGRKRVQGALAGAARRWAEASMDGYGRGLQVEPFVAIAAEFALHSWLDRDGGCLIGEPTRLRCDDDGAWLGNEPAGAALRREEREELEAAHAAVTPALAAAGYFGPFAIDAYRWRDAAGRERFQPLSELNARYTMGYFVGIGARQREWLHRSHG